MQLFPLNRGHFQLVSNNQELKAHFFDLQLRQIVEVPPHACGNPQRL